MDAGSVGQDGNPCFRTIGVAQPDGVVDYTWEFRIQGTLAVAAEGYRVEAGAVEEKLRELVLEGAADLRRRRQARVAAPVPVPSAFAVDAVELQSLPLVGSRLMPSEVPRRRDFMGPNTVSSLIIAATKIQKNTLDY